MEDYNVLSGSEYEKAKKQWKEDIKKEKAKMKELRKLDPRLYRVRAKERKHKNSSVFEKGL